MTITSNNILLLESERMADTADGGGRRTSREIVDGQQSGIFPKVSRLDAVYGRTNLRKVYGAVATASLDVYAGAHAAVMDAADDDRIHVNIFSTGSDYDTRAAARDRIESFVVAGPTSRMTLYGRQLYGQQAVSVYQRVEEPLPEVGDVFCLSKEVAGVVAYQQFVRVTDVTHEVRTFTDPQGNFERRIVALKIGAKLRHQFDGPEAPSRYADISTSAHLRWTTVADAARYYGIKKLAEPAAADALSLRVESVFSPIVPTTQRESAISLASVVGATAAVSSAGDAITEPVFQFLANAGVVGTIRTMRPITPGTLVVASGAAGYRSIDDGAGLVVKENAGAGYTGAVSYEAGVIQLTPDFSSGVYLTVSYVPKVDVSQPARSREIEITIGNRGTVFSEALNPLPAPGSVVLDYRAMGRWYRLRDDGAGQLVGNEADDGIGTVDYVTGALVATIGALPDVGSSVLISWGSPVDYAVRAGATSDIGAGVRQVFILASLPVQPGTLSLTFISDATAPYADTFTATADGSGIITGNGVTGRVIHETGEVGITYTTRLPNAGSVVTAAYNQLVPSDPENPINRTGTVTLAGLTLPALPVAAGSFRAVFPVSGQIQMAFGNSASFTGAVLVTDDGAGLLVAKAGQALGVAPWGSPAVVDVDIVLGTINYATGAVAFQATDIDMAYRAYQYTGPQWLRLGAQLGISGPGSYTYRLNGGDPVQTARTQEIALADSSLVLDLTAASHDSILPGSVLFSIHANATGATAYFFDRSGVLYTSMDVATGAALACGSVNYATGRVAITGGYASGSALNTVAVLACLSVYGSFTAIDAFFRTAGSPLRAGSLYVQAAALDGALLSGTADSNGVITGAKLRGQVVQEMGVARVEFGELIGGVWAPLEIAPSTLRYSAVVLSNLPLDADILGLDPVRLPQDGKVPIYRPADVVVIHNTQGFALPNPAVAGAAYPVGRTDLAALWLVGADGVRVPTSKYTTNPATGVVTMAADLSLAGIAQPIVARHRIEEMQLLSDVQINGLLGLTAPLSRAFPADSYVSSVLLLGDLVAGCTNLFDQGTWTGAWSDALIGSGATPQYNDLDHPIEVLNDGAVTDRWRIHFTTSNPTSGPAQFQIISENLGVIDTGNTGADCAPINQLTGKPYFVIRAAGWGIGWAVGNQLRFNTQAAGRPIWIARTVLPGASLAGDSFDIQLRGDVDE